MADFPSTHWSLIRLSGDSPSARRAAFGALARDYRAAIHAYFRARLGAGAAEDATQSFLADSFEHAWWARADAEIGSFRSFLLMLMRRRVSHLRDARQLDCAPLVDADSIADEAGNAESRFDSQFALVLTSRALDSLRGVYEARGRHALFDAILPLIGDAPDHGGIALAAAQLGMPPNTLSVEIGRLRARLRQRVYAELRELCADDATFLADRAAIQDATGANA